MRRRLNAAQLAAILALGASDPSFVREDGEKDRPEKTPDELKLERTHNDGEIKPKDQK